MAATPETFTYFYFAARPIAQLREDGVSSAWTFLTSDHLGTPWLATDLAGAEVWSGGFEPFGRDFAGALQDQIFLRLPGQWEDGVWQDATLGGDLFYNLHRWYEDQTGRYTSTDLMGVGAGPNLFSYGRSQPLRYVDPQGLYTVDGSCNSSNCSPLFLRQT